MATGGQFYWPPAGIFVAAYGQFFMAANRRSILVILWHLLHDPDARFHDLGADHFNRRTNPETSKRNHVRQLEAPGYTVTLTRAA